MQTIRIRLRWVSENILFRRIGKKDTSLAFSRNTKQNYERAILGYDLNADKHWIDKQMEWNWITYWILSQFDFIPLFIRLVMRE